MVKTRRVLDTRVPQGVCGSACVEHFTIPPDAQYLCKITHKVPPPGDYMRLLIDGQLYMSDTPMERATNREIISEAYGHMLIAGLGLGMILPAILSNPTVKTVTVLEINEDVIKLVAPHYANPMLCVLHADVFTWRPPKNAPKYDMVYLDIWPTLSDGNLVQIQRLRRRYRRWCNPYSGVVMAWGEDEIRALKRLHRYEMRLLGALRRTGELRHEILRGNLNGLIDDNGNIVLTGNGDRTRPARPDED